MSFTADRLLLFGATGLLLNHRATLKIPGAATSNTQWQLNLPQPLPADARALAHRLQQALAIERPPTLGRFVTDEPDGRADNSSRGGGLSRTVRGSAVAAAGAGLSRTVAGSVSGSPSFIWIDGSARQQCQADCV